MRKKIIDTENETVTNGAGVWVMSSSEEIFLLKALRNFKLRLWESLDWKKQIWIIKMNKSKLLNLEEVLVLRLNDYFLTVFSYFRKHLKANEEICCFSS